jgi:hypothetical protein
MRQRYSRRPEGPIEVVVGCGAGCPTRFPVSLVPLSHAPKPHPCGDDALCSPEAGGAPRSAPFVFLGWATEASSQTVVQQYRLRTRVPRVRPGAYAFAIYFDEGNRGAGGTLIADTSDPRKLLRVRAGQSSIASNGSGAETGG